MDAPGSTHFYKGNDFSYSLISVTSPLTANDDVTLNYLCHVYKEYEMNALNATWELQLNRSYTDGGGENSSRVFGIHGWGRLSSHHFSSIQRHLLLRRIFVLLRYRNC